MPRTAKLVRGTGGSVNIPGGDYPVVIVDPKQDRAKGSGKPVIVASIRVTEGKYKGTALTHNWSLQPQAMWRVTNDLLALGLLSDEQEEQLDAGELELDYREIVELLDGVEGTAAIFSEKYNGVDRSKISGFVAEGDGEDEEDEEDDDEGDSSDDEDEEEEPAPVAKKKGK